MAGAAGREADPGSSRAGRLGGPPELPPGSQLDALPGEAVCRADPGDHPPSLPPVAHLLPLTPLPCGCAAERHQNDQRATQGRLDTIDISTDSSIVYR